MIKVNVRAPLAGEAIMYPTILDWLLTNIHRPKIVMTDHKNFSKRWKSEDIWVLTALKLSAVIVAEFKNQEDALAFKLVWG